jgi:hypothetical protein
MGRVRKKGLPKRNTGHQNALYAPQFLGISAIGARYGFRLPSVEGRYDGGGGGGIPCGMRVRAGDFQEKFRPAKNISKRFFGHDFF